jgi:hypothetical protein
MCATGYPHIRRWYVRHGPQPWAWVITERVQIDIVEARSKKIAYQLDNKRLVSYEADGFGDARWL